MNIRLSETNNNAIILENEDSKLSISESIDGDIWFEATKDLVMMPINDFRGKDYKVHQLLARLMEQIVGRFILEGTNESRLLPEDFIDFENKIITWHSDNGSNSRLELMYEKDTITISLKGDPKSGNRVRIRTSGSEYGYYYQYFTRFYLELLQLALKEAKHSPNKQISETFSKEEVVLESPVQKQNKTIRQRIKKVLGINN